MAGIISCTTHHQGCKCRERHFKEIYIAANELLAKLVLEGEADLCDEKVQALTDSLFYFDGGTYDSSKMFSR